MPPATAPSTALRAVSRLIPRTPRTLPISRSFPTQQFFPRRAFPSVSPIRLRSFSSSLGLSAKHKPLYESPDPSTQPPSQPRPEPPSYQITFTCTPCSTRSTHRISKQGYHKGSVLITCPECRNRHIISDHLNIFGDKAITIEDLMRERGQLVKKGTLSEDGDVEFWEDMSTRKPEKTAADTDTLEEGKNPALP